MKKERQGKPGEADAKSVSQKAQTRSPKHKASPRKTAVKNRPSLAVTLHTMSSAMKLAHDAARAAQQAVKRASAAQSSSTEEVPSHRRTPLSGRSFGG